MRPIWDTKVFFFFHPVCWGPSKTWSRSLPVYEINFSYFIYTLETLDNHQFKDSILVTFCFILFFLCLNFFLLFYIFMFQIFLPFLVPNPRVLHSISLPLCLWKGTPAPISLAHPLPPYSFLHLPSLRQQVSTGLVASSPSESRQVSQCQGQSPKETAAPSVAAAPSAAALSAAAPSAAAVTGCWLLIS